VEAEAIAQETIYNAISTNSVFPLEPTAAMQKRLTARINCWSQAQQAILRDFLTQTKALGSFT
jgi:hypothetical protein